MMMPNIMPKGFNKSKYNKLSENEKYLYCMIESLFIRYLCDDITIQTFITKVINESKNHLNYEQSSIRVSEAVQTSERSYRRTRTQNTKEKIPEHHS